MSRSSASRGVTYVGGIAKRSACRGASGPTMRSFASLSWLRVPNVLMSCIKRSWTVRGVTRQADKTASVSESLRKLTPSRMLESTPARAFLLLGFASRAPPPDNEIACDAAISLAELCSARTWRAAALRSSSATFAHTTRASFVRSTTYSRSSRSAMFSSVMLENTSSMSSDILGSSSTGRPKSAAAYSVAASENEWILPCAAMLAVGQRAPPSGRN